MNLRECLKPTNFGQALAISSLALALVGCGATPEPNKPPILGPAMPTQAPTQPIAEGLPICQSIESSKMKDKTIQIKADSIGVLDPAVGEIFFSEVNRLRESKEDTPLLFNTFIEFYNSANIILLSQNLPPLFERVNGNYILNERSSSVDQYELADKAFKMVLFLMSQSPIDQANYQMFLSEFGYPHDEIQKLGSKIRSYQAQLSQEEREKYQINGLNPTEGNKNLPRINDLISGLQPSSPEEVQKFENILKSLEAIDPKLYDLFVQSRENGKAYYNLDGCKIPLTITELDAMPAAGSLTVSDLDNKIVGISSIKINRPIAIDSHNVVDSVNMRLILLKELASLRALQRLAGIRQ